MTGPRRRSGWPTGALLASAAAIVVVVPGGTQPPPDAESPAAAAPGEESPGGGAPPGGDGVAPPPVEVPPAVGSGGPVPGAGVGVPGQVLPVAYGAAVPAAVLAAYRRAVNRSAPACRLPVALLAAVGKVETGHARGGQVRADGTTVTPILGPVLDGTGGLAAIPDSDDGRFDQDTTWDRAVGPMQFVPRTWISWAEDGNDDGVADPHNVHDSSLAAARYLCAGGRDLGTDADLRAAVLSYNDSTSYLNLVLSWYAYYRGGGMTGTPTQGMPLGGVIPAVGGDPTGAPPAEPPPAHTPATPPQDQPAPPQAAPPDPPRPPEPEPPPTDPAPPPPAPEEGLLPAVVCGLGDLVGGTVGILGGLLGAPPPEPTCPPQ